MRDAVPSQRDALVGLAPAPPAHCPRCGGKTAGLANGRGRLDICARCGTIEFASPEGISLFMLHASAPPDPQHHEAPQRSAAPRAAPPPLPATRADWRPMWRARRS